ncbi:MAG: hypothetical protein NTW86_25270 [Candidatus Sumerlaeota bacterium]|nr:hypothetical protein [Candidatus Sumerlaeota bacterium]
MKKRFRALAQVLSGALALTAMRYSSAAATPVYHFAPSGHDGGGGQSAIAADPFTPGRIISGGDIWGFHRSTDYGRDWTPINVRDPGDTHNLFSAENHIHVAAVRFSLRTPNRAYAGAGILGAGGGFLRSDNAGDTWIMASNVPQFTGGNDDPPLVDKGHPRSVGNLIALDPNPSDADGGGEFIYAGTYKQGLMRSHDAGATWNTITLPGQSPTYIRGLAIDDTDPTTVYVATWDADTDGTNESICRVASARTATAGTLIADTPFLIAEELVVVHGILYVAANTDGVYQYDPSKPPAEAWTQVYTDSTPTQFYSIDGFWDGNASQAVLYAGSTDQAKSVGGGTNLYYSLIRSKDSGVTWTCLTADSSKIHTNMPMGDATGDVWWHSVSDVSACLGGNSFVACQTVVDPSDSAHQILYVCGRAGPWRSDDALTSDNPAWYPCMRHLNATVDWGVAADPWTPTRAYCLDMDWTFLYSTDNFDHVTQKAFGVGGSEEFCLDVDSTTNPGVGKVSPVYVGRTTDLAYCANPASGPFVSTGLNSTGNVYGCSIKKTSAGTVVLAAVENSGLWRKVGAGGSGDWGAAPAYNGNNIMQSLDSRNTHSVFSWGGGASEMVYFTDRQNGVFRSMNGGVDWIKVTAPTGGWTGSGTHVRESGSVAVDPTDDAHCYVTQTKGLYFSSNANATPQPTFAKVAIADMGTATPGWAVYDDEGDIYVNSLADGSYPPKIFFQAHGDSAWHDIAQNERIFQSQCGFARQMAVGPGPDHRIYLSNNGCGVCVGTQSGQSGVDEFQLY